MNPKQICFVCMANYCRSPVAEVIFNSLDNDEHFAISAGILPFKPIGIDERSEKFIVSKGIKPKIHNSQKISKTIIEKSQIVFALDLLILNELNIRFKNHQMKFKLLNYKQPSLHLVDPYKLKDPQYELVMTNIYKLIKNGLL